ncbi:MAG: hypothetical protein LBN25_04910 [Christensenellaceae bacterium]|jgi:hypothetical protein|nr:hypothetical protein [Christensenellaceae bacterium]
METVLIIIPVLAAATSVITFFIARGNDAKERGIESGTIKADLDYIKSTLTSLREEQKAIAEKTDGLIERVITAEQIAKTAIARIDVLENHYGN